MRVTRISLALEKRSNDKDYGSELSRVELVADLEPGDELLASVENLQGQARLFVERDLAQSANLNVRRSVIRQIRRCARCAEPLADDEMHYMHKACSEAEDAEREARRQREREERERERQEWQQEVGVGAGSDNDNDDDVPL